MASFASSATTGGSHKQPGPKNNGPKKKKVSENNGQLCLQRSHLDQNQLTPKVGEKQCMEKRERKKEEKNMC